jgi:Kef-type K+ transport system membrane component KefB
MLVVFGAAKLLAEIFEHLNLPGIAGEILAGIIIGPSLLGWVHPTGLAVSLGDLGVMFLLFRVGLDMRSTELMQVGITAATVAAGGIVCSFGLAWGALHLWGVPSLEALFVSAALAATSAGIAAEVLSRNGLINQKAARIILAAAVIDDIGGLIALTVVSSVARGSVDAPRLAFTVLLAIAFVVAVARWGPQIIETVFSRAESRLRVAEAEFTLTICLLFTLSVISVYTGIASVIGAFLAGLALSGRAGERVRTLIHGATELLVPFFLAGIGLRVDLAALRSPRIAALTVVIFAIAVIGKLAGCSLGALKHGAWKVGVGMIPRGEVTMVVAQLGLTMGVVTQSVFSGVVAAAAATTLIAPALIRRAFRTETAL